MPPEGGSATAEVSLQAGRLTWSSPPPVVLRRTGRRRLHLVQVGGGPLGGDVLGLDLDLGPGEELEIATAAATVVQRGPDGTEGAPASFALHARLAAGASLRWSPAPCVVTDTASWVATTRLELAAGAQARLGEQFVLGRHGQRGGRLRSATTVDLDGRPLLATTTEVDAALPVHCGPGGVGTARSIGTVVEVGDPDLPRCERAGEEPDVIWACSPLEGPGSLLTALGGAAAVATVLARG